MEGKGASGPVVVISQAEELKKLLGAPATPAEAATDVVSTTEHAVEIGGRRIPFRATCGTLPVRLDDPDKPKSRMFHVSYVRTDVDSARRPVTFCFNGGPGSSSIWLHMGMLGPYRVAVDVDARPAPGAIAAENPHGLLDVTDLVFVDPVATGFSRPDDGKGREYHGVQADVEAMAEFVRRWITRHGRWGSPKYLAGESYGTTRAAALAHHLHERHGIALTGLVLVSVALNFQTLKFDRGNDLPYVLYAPAYAATAAYHGRVQADPVAHAAEVERWAVDRYLPALIRGSSLPEAEQQKVAEELAARIGLSAQFVRRCQLRVELGRFCAELLRDRGLAVGRLDARFVGQPVDAAIERLQTDPSMAAILGPYASALHHHLRERLQWNEEDAYEILSLPVNSAWAWGSDNQYLDVTIALRDALADNPHLRVFVASGAYDLATPPAATDYTLNQLWLDRRAVRHVVYPAGHMMYLHEPTLRALRGDLFSFYGDAPPAAG